MLRDRRVLLGLIVVVALACRAAGAGDALSADEGYSWLVASAPDADAFLDRLALYENTPPVYYLLLAPLPHRVCSNCGTYAGREVIAAEQFEDSGADDDES